MAKKSVFDQEYWERKHKRQLNARARYVKQLFDDLARKVASLGVDINLPSEKEFRLEDYPALNKRIDKMVREVAKKVTHNIEEGEEEAWLLSNAKNDALVDYVTQGVKLPKEVVSGWKNQNLLALSAFQKRKIAGMGLSERVWNLTQTAKQELELALDIGIGAGKSADELSRDIRQYLNEPNKLFRRVRDERGILRLSKAAKMYHPGRGVYRSSYKNALRLTQTETNMAYRSADHERWEQLPFVIGQRINLSNNHTLNGVPFYDICDELAGVYPKDFKFVGWHPKCHCYKTSELAKREEWIEYLKKIANGEDVSDFKFSGQVKEVPQALKDWVKGNKERAKGWSSLPYFVRDNPKYIKGFKVNIYSPVERKFTRAFRTKDAMSEVVNSLQKKYPNIPNTEKAAIYHYTKEFGAAFRHLNRALRKNKMTEFDLAFSQLLSQGIEKLPIYKGVTYRTIRLNKTNFFDWLNKAKMGSVEVFDSFTSTSKDMGVVKKLEERGRKKSNETDVLLIINGKSGRDLSGLSQYDGKTRKSQQEVLYNKGCTFKFQKHILEKGQHIIYLTEL